MSLNSSSISGLNDSGFPSTSFVLSSSFCVFIMTPGLGLFYSGLSTSKNALSLIFMSFLCTCVVTVQWFLFGFSLAFSETGSAFIGDFSYIGLENVGNDVLTLTSPSVTVITFAIYQLQFSTISPAIIFGSVAGRLRILPNILFILIWTTLVYDPVSYWTWGARGWIRNMSCLNKIGPNDTPCLVGGFDFAGGYLHIASGFAGLAYCILVGNRTNYGKEHNKPHNLMSVCLGTTLLWFGWYGFNSGSAISASSRASMAAMVTTIAGSVGALTWLALEYHHTKKYSVLAMCTGAITGLVVITPASGYVAPWAAVAISVSGIIVVYYLLQLKMKSPRLNAFYDDTLDAFGIHGVGGVYGNIMTGVFHQRWVSDLDGEVTAGGIFDGNWVNLAQQLIGSLTIAAYSFVVTYAILYAINRIPGMKLRCSECEEAQGNDFVELGEEAYTFFEGSSLPSAVRSAKENNHDVPLQSFASHKVNNKEITIKVNYAVADDEEDEVAIGKLVTEENNV